MPPRTLHKLKRARSLMLAAAIDHHAGSLQEMLANRQYPKIAEWFNQQGVPCTTTEIVRFFQRRKHAKNVLRLTSQVVRTAEFAGLVKKLLKQIPAPGIEVVVRLHQDLAVKVCSEADRGQKNDPEAFKLADRLTRTALNGHEIVERIKIDYRTLGLKERAAKLQSPGDGQVFPAERIAGMRLHAFKDVEALENSGTLNIPGP